MRYKLGTDFKTELEAKTVSVQRRRPRAARPAAERRPVEIIARSPVRPGLGAD